MEKQPMYGQLFFDQADVFMIAIGSNEVVVEVNKKACKILGYSAEEVKGKKWFDNFVPKESRENVRRLFHDMLSGNLRHVHYEHSFVTKQGEEKTFNFHNTLVSDEKGNTVGTLSSGEDVTVRRQKEKVLKKVESRLQTAIDSMIEGYQIIDYDWRYVYLNEAAAKQGRKPKQELLGYTMMQAYPGIDKTPLFNHLRSCMANRVPHQIDNEFLFPDGSTGWFQLRIEPVPEGILILSMDITRSKEFESELNKYRDRLEEVIAERTAECAKTNEKLLMEIQDHKKTKEGLNLRAAILDNAREAIFLVNTKGYFAYANETASKFYGYNLDEFLNKNISALLPTQDEPSVKALLIHVAEKGQTSLEMIHLRKDGTQMPVKLYSNVVKTVHGQFIVFLIHRLNYR
jgi:PAS domain S-box-containing protein